MTAMNDGRLAPAVLYGRAISARKRNRWHESFTLLRRAAARKEAHLARYDLAEWYLEGYKDRRGKVVLRRNLPVAVRLLRSAAEAGLTDAYLTLANCYASGIGVSRDFRSAARWYRAGARAGDADAAFNLSVEYRLAGNRRSELRWLRRASLIGSHDARVLLAIAELRGRTSAVSRKRAHRTLNAAWRRDARDVLEILRSVGLSRQDVRAMLTSFSSYSGSP